MASAETRSLYCRLPTADCPSGGIPMFEPVSSRVSFPELEAGVLQLWKDKDIFRRSVDERPAHRVYSFFEGPPTANGRPGIHHVLARVFKDAFPRFWTMK